MLASLSTLAPFVPTFVAEMLGGTGVSPVPPSRHLNVS